MSINHIQIKNWRQALHLQLHSHCSADNLILLFSHFCCFQPTIQTSDWIFQSPRRFDIHLAEKKWRRQMTILWLVGNNNFGVFVDNRTAVVGNLSIDFEFPCSHCWVFRANELQIWHPGPRKYTLLILWCCEKLHCDGCWISNYGISGSHTSDCKWSPRYLHISKVTKHKSKKDESCWTLHHYQLLCCAMLH